MKKDEQLLGIGRGLAELLLFRLRATPISDQRWYRQAMLFFSRRRLKLLRQSDVFGAKVLSKIRVCSREASMSYDCKRYISVNLRKSDLKCSSGNGLKPGLERIFY